MSESRQRLHVYLDPRVRETVRYAAEQFDLSMAAYIRRAVTMQMKRDGVELKEEQPAWLTPPS